MSLLQGDIAGATRHLHGALVLYRELGIMYGEADTLISLGEISLASGRPGDARAQHTAALSLAEKTSHKHEQARAHRGLGAVCHADGDLAGARRHWQQAFTLFTELGTPEADQVRAQLAAA